MSEDQDGPHDLAAARPQIKIGMDAKIHRHVVKCAADLARRVSKAPRAAVVIPELADEESPEGWQVMGPTSERVIGTIRELLQKAVHDLTHEIPEEYRHLPQVKEQCEQLEGLLEGRHGSWPFIVELQDAAIPSGSEAHAECEAPPWLQAFLDGEDGKGSAFFEAEVVPSEAIELGAPETLRRCVIAPGNGCDCVQDSNWYGWLQTRLKKGGLFEEVVCRDFPDPYEARRSIWLPFMREELMVGPNTVLIGHSSGAEAAMRYAEENHVGGIVLVSACHSDLGDPGERASGYYPPSGGEWKWDAIRKNSGWIVQFHSKDDPLVPVQEGRVVAKALGSEYHELDGHSHFFEPFEQIIDVLRL
eukprot:CAMPEP_0117473714 /NCGR_PEP_ID=MMETSP0784-20121206/8911_1 /TAXON_ID=39447 /ORGANISM="" /LENGTH=359 /DNA_ID=CAMNT_0005267917 /DNA_START=50 /DNA_END=1125 /DNA_ORIENTATION=+